MRQYFGKIGMLIVLCLTACSYQPMYSGKKDSSEKTFEKPASQGLSEVEVANIPDRAGQILRNDLIDRINYIGYSDKTNYLLTIKLSETRDDLGLKKDDTSSLYVYKMTANAALRDKRTGKIVKKFTVKAESTVNVIREQFSILVASETGRKRALKQIADIIINRLGLYFSTQGKAQLEQ